MKNQYSLVIIFVCIISTGNNLFGQNSDKPDSNRYVAYFDTAPYSFQFTFGKLPNEHDIYGEGAIELLSVSNLLALPNIPFNTGVRVGYNSVAKGMISGYFSYIIFSGDGLVIHYPQENINYTAIVCQINYNHYLTYGDNMISLKIVTTTSGTFKDITYSPTLLYLDSGGTQYIVKNKHESHISYFLQVGYMQRQGGVRFSGGVEFTMF